MSIALLDRVSVREGLGLHRSFLSMAKGMSSIVLVTAQDYDVNLASLTGSSIPDLVSQLGEKAKALPNDQLAGFAGANILSLHFTAAAAQGLVPSFQLSEIPAHCIQLVDEGGMQTDAITQWIQLHEKSKKSRREKSIEIQPFGNGKVNVVFPDLATMQTFELWMRHGLFKRDCGRMQHAANMGFRHERR